MTLQFGNLAFLKHVDLAIEIATIRPSEYVQSTVSLHSVVGD